MAAGQAQPPYILVFDLDDTIVRRMPASLYFQLRWAYPPAPSIVAEVKKYLIDDIVDILVKAAKLRDRSDHRVESIFLLTNNAGENFVKTVDQLLLTIAQERIGPLKPRALLQGTELPGIKAPVFFDAILMREDPQRRPTRNNWPEGALYSPAKNMSDVAVMSLFQSPRKMNIDEILPRVVFFDDYPDHEFKDQLDSSQYIVVKQDPMALGKELGKLPPEFWEPLGMPQGGGRRLRRTRTRRTRRRVRSRRTQRTTKVYRRRR